MESVAGTAFLVAADVLVTCAHVASARGTDAAADELEVLLVSETGTAQTRAPLARPPIVIAEHDVAILHLVRGSTAGRSPLPLIRGAPPGAARRLQRLGLVGIGFPAGEPVRHFVRELQVQSSEDRGRAIDLVHTSGGARHGLSGGPVVVYTARGPACAGMLRSGGEGRPVAVFLGANRLGELLADHAVNGVEWMPWTVVRGSRRPISALIACVALLVVALSVATWWSTRRGSTAESTTAARGSTPIDPDRPATPTSGSPSGSERATDPSVRIDAPISPQQAVRTFALSLDPGRGARAGSPPSIMQVEALLDTTAETLRRNPRMDADEVPLSRFVELVMEAQASDPERLTALTRLGEIALAVGRPRIAVELARSAESISYRIPASAAKSDLDERRLQLEQRARSELGEAFAASTAARKRVEALRTSRAATDPELVDALLALARTASFANEADAAFADALRHHVSTLPESDALDATSRSIIDEWLTLLLKRSYVSKEHADQFAAAVLAVVKNSDVAAEEIVELLVRLARQAAMSVAWNRNALVLPLVQSAMDRATVEQRPTLAGLYALSMAKGVGVDESARWLLAEAPRLEVALAAENDAGPSSMSPQSAAEVAQVAISLAAHPTLHFADGQRAALARLGLLAAEPAANEHGVLADWGSPVQGPARDVDLLVWSAREALRSQAPGMPANAAILRAALVAWKRAANAVGEPGPAVDATKDGANPLVASAVGLASALLDALANAADLDRFATVAHEAQALPLDPRSRSMLLMSVVDGWASLGRMDEAATAARLACAAIANVRREPPSGPWDSTRLTLLELVVCRRARLDAAAERSLRSLCAELVAFLPGFADADFARTIGDGIVFLWSDDRTQALQRFEQAWLKGDRANWSVRERGVMAGLLFAGTVTATELRDPVAARRWVQRTWRFGNVIMQERLGAAASAASARVDDDERGWNFYSLLALQVPIAGGWAPGTRVEAGMTAMLPMNADSSGDAPSLVASEALDDQADSFDRRITERLRTADSFDGSTLFASLLTTAFDLQGHRLREADAMLHDVRAYLQRAASLPQAATQSVARSKLRSAEALVGLVQAVVASRMDLPSSAARFQEVLRIGATPDDVEIDGLPVLRLMTGAALLRCKLDANAARAVAEALGFDTDPDGASSIRLPTLDLDWSYEWLPPLDRLSDPAQAGIETLAQRLSRTLPRLAGGGTTAEVRALDELADEFTRIAPHPWPALGYLRRRLVEGPLIVALIATGRADRAVALAQGVVEECEGRFGPAAVQSAIAEAELVEALVAASRSADAATRASARLAARQLDEPWPDSLVERLARIASPAFSARVDGEVAGDSSGDDGAGESR